MVTNAEKSHREVVTWKCHGYNVLMDCNAIEPVGRIIEQRSADFDGLKSLLNKFAQYRELGPHGSGMFVSTVLRRTTLLVITFTMHGCLLLNEDQLQ